MEPDRGWSTGRVISPNNEHSVLPGKRDTTGRGEEVRTLVRGKRRGSDALSSRTVEFDDVLVDTPLRLELRLPTHELPGCVDRRSIREARCPSGPDRPLRADLPAKRCP